MTEFEFEELKRRVSELESEVDSLKKLVGTNNDIKATENIMSVEKPIAVDVAITTPVHNTDNLTCVKASCAKVVGIDAEGVRHQNGVIRYVYRGSRYVAFTELDLNDEEWALFDTPGLKDAFISADVLYPYIELGGKRFDMFGHVDSTVVDWKRIKNEATGRMEFIKVPKGADTSKLKMENVSKAAAPKSEVSFEKALGSKWMGIFASVLIFVGFIFFGAAIYSLLNDYIKSAILLIISGIFTFVGLYKLNKDDGGTVLWNIVSGCGIGGSYITFVLMNLQFHIINDIILVGLLVVWIATTIYLAKRFSSVFFYVCYAGIVISTVLCEINWAGSLLGFIFYLLATLALIAASYDEEYSHNYFWVMQFPFMFIYFSIVYRNSILSTAILWVALLAILIAQTYIFDIESKADHIIYAVANFIFSMLAFALLADNLHTKEYDLVMSIALLATLVALAINYSIKYEDETLFKNIMFYFTAVVILFLPFNDIYKNYIGLAIFFIPALTYGVFAKKLKFVGTGCTYMALYFFVNLTDIDVKLVTYVTAITLVGLIAVCFMDFIMWMRMYIVAFISMAVVYLCGTQNWYNGGIAFLITAIICYCINNSKFSHDENILDIFTRIYSIIVLLVGYWMTAFYDAEIILFGNTIYDSKTLYAVLIALATLGLGVICQRYSYWYALTSERVSASVLTATSYLFMTLSILHRLEATGYIVSLILILLAIAFIVTGFKFDNKSIRLYGLIMSLICTVKIVFIDITYDSSIYYPIGLFICGGLCLFICWIYNKIEKNSQIEEQNQG